MLLYVELDIFKSCVSQLLSPKQATNPLGKDQGNLIFPSRELKICIEDEANCFVGVLHVEMTLSPTKC